MQVARAVRRRKDGEETATVFIDYARAFDSADCSSIVKGLLFFGVEKHLVAWIAGFLQERTAQVRVNSTLSEDMGLTCGVPQGSVVGPLPFIVAVDSLSKRLNCIPGLQHGFFADDLTIVRTSADLSEIQQTIQQGLDCIANWPAEYYMEVSAEKTEHTLFGARETNLLSLEVGETVLKEERTPKPLGLTMQPHKGLTKHALSVKAAAGTRLMQLRAVASPEWGPQKGEAARLSPCAGPSADMLRRRVMVVRYIAVGSRAAGDGAGTGGTHSGRYSRSRKLGGCPGRGGA
ncbi:hypothetical protein TRVL_08655 [Trypanosoma vivax]|nr:hypothetical protein TRVL_08655 [Trypanosoma vivax]